MREKDQFRVSVRDLVAAACPPKDLARSGGSRRHALAGIQEHLRIQAGRPEGFRAEVPVSMVIRRDSFDLEIFGRMDGIMETPESTLVEEIKTCRADPLAMAQTPDIRHMAQLKCYGYMAAFELGLSRICLKLTYARPGTQETASAELVTTIDDLDAFFQDLVSAYLDLLTTRSAWKQVRNQSLKTLSFPFPEFRTGQRDLAEAVYKTVKHGKQLFARAPTGTGKTMACLFPAVKAMGLGLADKIFYLTAKTPGRTVAQQAITRLSDTGARIKSVVITAKQKTCPLPDLDCEACPYARAYYTKLERALTGLLDHDHFDREQIESLARDHEICPFELSLDLSLVCDIIICDLNYAFDPRVYLKRFFDRNTRNLVFLIDEAHNLPHRLRSMYSADLDLSGILQAREDVLEAAPALAEGLSDIARAISTLQTTHLGPAAPAGKGVQEFAALDHLPEPLMETLERFCLAADLWLEHHPTAPVREGVLEMFFLMNGFFTLAGHFGSHYRVFIRSSRKAEPEVSLFCLDPAPVFSGLVKRCGSAVFFSATFFPFAYYQQVLLGEGTVPPWTISLDPPFPREHLGLMVHKGIKTTYRRRRQYFQETALAIAHTASARPGNYLVFFPSYAYMAAVLDCLPPGDLPIQVQTPDMTEGLRSDFLTAFQPGAGVVGFAVMGGIFGEGIDLPGDRLIGVVIVGVGLPMICPEQEEIRSYYDSLGHDGFFIAYQMPGFSRVLQAAGRLIRGREDRGVVLLLDERFMRPDYQALFPKEWLGHKVVTATDALPGILDAFWTPPDL